MSCHFVIIGANNTRDNTQIFLKLNFILILKKKFMSFSHNKINFLYMPTQILEN